MSLWSIGQRQRIVFNAQNGWLLKVSAHIWAACRSGKGPEMNAVSGTVGSAHAMARIMIWLVESARDQHQEILTYHPIRLFRTVFYASVEYCNFGRSKALRCLPCGDNEMSRFSFQAVCGIIISSPGTVLNKCVFFMSEVGFIILGNRNTLRLMCIWRQCPINLICQIGYWKCHAIYHSVLLVIKGDIKMSHRPPCCRFRRFQYLPAQYKVVCDMFINNGHFLHRFRCYHSYLWIAGNGCSTSN